jgi:hypothetical protein
MMEAMVCLQEGDGGCDGRESAHALRRSEVIDQLLLVHTSQLRLQVGLLQGV